MAHYKALTVALYINFLFQNNESCTKIIVKSLDPDIDWLDGTFLLNPTLVADGRPVYVEQLGSKEDQDDEEITKRAIYHYSHEPHKDAEKYANTDFSGRWILGNSMYSSNGWFYIESWSISPAQNMMNALVNSDELHNENPNNDPIHPKVQWRVYKNNKWEFDTNGFITLTCDTVYDDITQDWLFVHTPNNYQFNILNSQLEHEIELQSITQETLYGFYYRISAEYWRKVESKIFLRRRDLTKNPLSTPTTLAADDDELEYSFIFFDGYTKSDGTPDMKLFTSGNNKGFRVVTYAKYYEEVNDKDWYVVDNKNRQYEKDPIKVNIIDTKNKDDDIYTAFRRYWREIKSNSFDAAVNELSLTQTQKDKLIVETNNGLPFMMLGLGTGGLNQRAAERSQQQAMNIGYRVIDGAQAYENELGLGKILTRKRVNNLVRDNIYITSKVWPTNLGFVQTYQAILQSLNKVRTNYFDLYMIHWNECDPKISWMHCEEVL